MSWRTQLVKLRQVFRRRVRDGELAEEIKTHLAMEEQQNREVGMPPDEARYAAMRRFGNATLTLERSRDMWGWSSIETLGQDLRYGLRQLRRSPGFTVVAVTTLALGIGANTAIFQLLDAVRLRSLPVPSPQELAEIRIVGGNGGMGINNGEYPQLTRPIWQEIQRQQQAFSGVFAWGTNGAWIGKDAERRWGYEIFVSGDFFRVLGMSPWRGRLILPEDESSCPESRIVVSYAFWQGQMGGRDLGANSTLLVDGALRQVVGVTPPGFFGLAVGESFDIALPFCQPQEPLRRDVFDIAVMGRLRRGWTLPRASAQLQAISPGIFEATVPPGRSTQSTETYKRFRLAAYPASNGVSSLRTQYDSSLWLLVGITGLVLLIACANLANLMLARASTREREIAVRLALGASRTRLLRQLLAESSLLAAVGAVLGIGVAESLSRVLVRSLSTDSNTVSLSVSTDWRVLAFAALAAALTCAVFGATPALRATRVGPVNAMKGASRGMTGSRERFSMQRLMVVTQIAVSLLLLVGALLFVRSFRNLMAFDPGMREAGITVAIVAFQHSHVAHDQLAEFKRQLLEDVSSAPGILSAATTTNTPLLGGSWTHDIHVGATQGWSKFTWVSPDYFRTMGIAVIAGRSFTANDTQASGRVAVVNRAFIRQYLGGADPIGKTLRTEPEPDYPSTVYEIVGVIPDTQYDSLRGQTPPMTFAPASQYPADGPWVFMMIHSNMPSAAVAATVKRSIAAKHPEIVTTTGDFQTWIRDGLVRERLMATLSGFFGLLAALLATVGLYGVISYIVARRRNEIGIRLALGARRGQVIGMVLRETLRLLLIGTLIGAALSLAAGRGAGSLLFKLKPYDPLTLAAAGSLLALIAIVASFLPARRASKVDPMEALRCE